MTAPYRVCRNDSNPATPNGLCTACNIKADQPDFDAFAANPFGPGVDSEPTEAQERVARELRGMYVSLRRQGFTEDHAIFLVATLLETKDHPE